MWCHVVVAVLVFAFVVAVVVVSIYLSIYLPIYPILSYSFLSYPILSTYLSYPNPIPSYPSIYLSVCLPVCLSTCKLENAAILRDFLSSWTWEHQKRSNSARLPKFLNLTTSKSKQFCETSSFFEVDNIKKDAILRDFLQKWKVVCRADGLVPMRFAIFPLHLSKVLCLPRKKWCQVIRSAAPVTQNHLPKTDDLMLQNATPLRKSAPGPPYISDEHVSCTAHATENASLQILFKCPTPAIVFGNATKPSRFAHFWQGAQSLAPATQNDKKWSEHAMFCAFWLGNLLRATTACNFSSLIWPHGFAPAALASLLFDPPEQQTIGKTECFATFLPFCAPGSSFFWDFLFFDLLSSSLLFSYSSHLCFSSVHVVGSLTSKLPSISSNGCNYEKQYT